MHRILVGVASLAVAFGGVATPASATPVWSAPVAISSLGAAETYRATETVPDGHAATTVWSIVSGNNAGITFASTSNDSGATWSARKILYLTPSVPAVAISTTGERIVAVLQVAGRIVVQRSTDSGRTWLSLNRLIPITNDLAVGNATAFSLDASPDAMTLMVSWLGKGANGVQLVYSSRSTDGGATWSAATAISSARAIAKAPVMDMSADGTRAVIAYLQHPIGGTEALYSRSTSDGGQTWSVERKVSLIGHTASHPTVALADTTDSAWLMWADRTNASPTIFGVHSDTSGRTWSGARTISANGSIALFPEVQLVPDGSRGIAIWLQDVQGSPEMYATTLNGDTMQWSAAIAIGPGIVATGGEGVMPDLSMSSSARIAAVAWTSMFNDSTSVAISTTLDGGSTWASTRSPAPALNLQAAPQIAMSGDGALTFLSELAAVNTESVDIPLYMSVMTQSGDVDPNGGAGGGGANGGQAAAVLIPQTATVTFPARLKRHGWSRVLKLPITTNAGQAVTVTAAAVIKKTHATASRRDFRTKIKHNGTANVFKIRLSGRKALNVSVVVTAPETAVYDDFAVAKGYDMKKSRRWH